MLRKLGLASLWVGVVVSGACGPLNIPITLESPEQTLDVTSAVNSAQSKLCDDPNSDTCKALQAFCASESGRNCTPPTLPDVIPTSVVVVQGQPPVSADSFINSSKLTDATAIKLAIPVDLTAQLAAAGIGDVSKVNEVNISGITIAWPANTLTFDAPGLDLYVGGKVDGLNASDATQVAALITAGTVKKMGTIDAQPAGSSADRPVKFTTDGNTLFNTAVKSAKFTLVAVVPDGQGFTLKNGPTADTKLKPQGVAKLKVKGTLVFTLSANDLVQKAQAAIK